MKTKRCNNAAWLSSVVCAVLLLLMLSAASHASDVRYLWQSRDQFVALERQDTASTGPAQPNDHPAELPLDRLTAILASIDIRPATGAKPEPLFTGPALEALAPYLRQALQQASPNQDVTFAVIGLHNTLYGLAKSPKVTTGRVFYKAGRLNIIVGLVQQEVRDRDDRRLFPFTPGSRQKASTGEWTLLTNTPLVRGDWMAFGEEWQAPVAPAAAVEQRLPPVQAAPVPTEKRNSDTRSPADRLTTLNELKNKGLINEEEYRSKRLEIMNGL
jgi:hypothetical protein